MNITDRLLMADAVLNQLVKSGDVSEERVQEIVEAEREVASAHIESFRDRMDLDSLESEFDQRKEFDKTVHFSEDMISKMGDIRMEVFDPEPVKSHQQVLEKIIDICFEEVCE